jgi:rubrerythrin
MEDASVVTAAVVISFSGTLEESSAEFYRALADKWTEHRDQFLSFAKDCERVKTQVLRTYQETISDALDATSSFKGLKLETYEPDMAVPADVSYADAIRMAIAIEDKAIAFYRTVAEQASLLATIPRAFNRAANRHEKNRATLQSLLDDTGA